jgi:hypothetical protein
LQKPNKVYIFAPRIDEIYLLKYTKIQIKKNTQTFIFLREKPIHKILPTIRQYPKSRKRVGRNINIIDMKKFYDLVLIMDTLLFFELMKVDKSKYGFMSSIVYKIQQRTHQSTRTI